MHPFVLSVPSMWQDLQFSTPGKVLQHLHHSAVVGLVPWGKRNARECAGQAPRTNIVATVEPASSATWLIGGIAITIHAPIAVHGCGEGDATKDVRKRVKPWLPLGLSQPSFVRNEDLAALTVQRWEARPCWQMAAAKLVLLVGGMRLLLLLLLLPLVPLQWMTDHDR